VNIYLEFHLLEAYGKDVLTNTADLAWIDIDGDEVINQHLVMLTHTLHFISLAGVAAYFPSPPLLFFLYFLFAITEQYSCSIERTSSCVTRQ
jgi:hypothetical protein